METFVDKQHEQLIIHRLEKIREEHSVRILFASESGSRAWGFPSPDSDYDVRFIYRYPLDHYLSILDRKDHIEEPVTDEIDAVGWDIRKSLLLLRKSNISLFEWPQSSIVYHSAPGFLEAFMKLSADFFSPRAAAYHYHGIVRKYLDLLEEEPNGKLKRYFYALRSAMACRWVVERGTAPPIRFDLLSKLLQNEEVEEYVQEMMEEKIQHNEDYVHHKEPVVLEYLEELLGRLEEKAAALPTAKRDLQAMDNFYRAVLKGGYDH